MKTSDQTEQKADHSAENPDTKANQILETAKELLLPGVYDTISFDTKVSLDPSGGPEELRMTGIVPFEKLSEKGIVSAKQQGYSKGDIVTIGFSSKSINEKFDILGKKVNVVQQPSSSKGCYVATATFGSPLAPEVRTLYEFRDLILLKSKAGRQFIVLYYRVSPALSRYINRFSFLKKISRLILKPVILMARIHLKFNMKKNGTFYNR